MRLIEGGREPFRKDEPVVVGGREARVICPGFQTHVYRGMISVDFGEGELDLVEQECVRKVEDAGGPS